MPATKRRDHKFREMTLYIAKLAESDPKCGRTKLNKLLFYADFRAYDILGKSISGQTYQKLPNGPAPKRLMPVVEQMQLAGECAWAQRNHYGRALKKLIPLREPDVTVFEPAEIDLMRNVHDELWPLNATEVSDLSHNFAGWQASGMNEDIPYETVFVDDPRPLSPEEEDWALAAIKEYCERKAS
jgi:hypothetical protein